MKQHMLTHKIRDMPSHLFEKTSPASTSSSQAQQPVSVASSLVDETSNTSSIESKEASMSAASSQVANAMGLRCVPIESLTSLQKAAAASSACPSNLSPGGASVAAILPTTLASSISEVISAAAIVPSAQKRSPDNDSALPVPKRQPSKYLSIFRVSLVVEKCIKSNRILLLFFAKVYRNIYARFVIRISHRRRLCKFTCVLIPEINHSDVPYARKHSLPKEISK